MPEGRGSEPFIWDAIHGMRNLGDVLRDEYGLGDSLSGWNLVSATAISDDGRTIVGLGNGGPGSFGWVAYLGTRFPGDANFDDVVNFTDLGILLNNYNLAGTFASGDFDNSGTVDFADLGILLGNYNQTAPALSSAAAVPEPTTLMLAGIGFLGVYIARRRRLRT